VIRKLKERALSKTVQTVLNTQMGAYGKVVMLTLDTSLKELSAEIALKGESETVCLKSARYELFKKDAKHYIRFNEIETSRIWMNHLAAEYLEGRVFEVPQKYAAVLKALV